MRVTDFLFSVAFAMILGGLLTALAYGCGMFDAKPALKPATLLLEDTTLHQQWQTWGELVDELAQIALTNRPAGEPVPMHELQRMQEIVATMRDMIDPAHLARLENRVAKIERYLLAVHQAAVEAAK